MGLKKHLFWTTPFNKLRKILWFGSCLTVFLALSLWLRLNIFPLLCSQVWDSHYQDTNFLLLRSSPNSVFRITPKSRRHPCANNVLLRILQEEIFNRTIHWSNNRAEITCPRITALFSQLLDALVRCLDVAHMFLQLSGFNVSKIQTKFKQARASFFFWEKTRAASSLAAIEAIEVQ